MLRRFARIAPLYWLATLAVVVVAALAPALLKCSLLSGPHIGASLAFIPMRSPAFPDNYWPLVILGWTLNYEMAFYAVFAVTLWLSACLWTAQAKPVWRHFRGHFGIFSVASHATFSGWPFTPANRPPSDAGGDWFLPDARAACHLAQMAGHTWGLVVLYLSVARICSGTAP